MRCVTALKINRVARVSERSWTEVQHLDERMWLGAAAQRAERGEIVITIDRWDDHARFVASDESAALIL